MKKTVIVLILLLSASLLAAPLAGAHRNSHCREGGGYCDRY